MTNSFIGILNYGIDEATTHGLNDHSKLVNLDYDSSGHTGFAKSPDNTLLTTDKTLAGAINELFNSIKTLSNKLPKTISGGNPFTKGMLSLDGGNHDTIFSQTRLVDGGGV